MKLFLKCSCSWPTAVVLAGAVAGCNIITGADDLVLVRPRPSSSSASGDPLGGQGPGGSTASGWGGSGTGGLAAGGYGGSASSSSSSSGEPPPPCDYPQGPYGIQLNDTVSPSFSWNGYPEGPVGQVVSISLADYYDCDGSKGINALMIESSQYG